MHAAYIRIHTHTHTHTHGSCHCHHHHHHHHHHTLQVRALDPKRKMDYGEKVKNVLGTDTQQAFTSVSAIVSMMKGKFFGGKVRGFTGFVDAEGVAQAKAAAKRRGVVPFVSTNDILTSAFSNAIG